MLKGKLITILSIVLLLATSGLKAQSEAVNLESLSFDDAARFMDLNSYTVSQYNNKVLQKEQELKAARGLYFPRISVGANYVFMSEDVEVDHTPIKETITPLYEALGNYRVFSDVPNPDPATNGLMPMLPDDIATAAVRQDLLDGLEQINSADWVTTIQKKQFGMVNASFMMPIYTGGKINAANKAAKIELDEAELQKKVKQDELFCELIERYYGLVLSNRALEVRKEVLETMQAHLNDAQKLKEQGMIADAEYLHAKVYFSEAEREYKKALRTNKVVNNSLLNTLSIDSLVEVNTVSNLFYLENIDDINYFIEKGEQNSNMLELVNHKKELAHQGYKAERANFLPTVAAMGTYDIVNKDLSPYMPEYVVGVGASWTIFNGTERLRKVKAAQYQESQANDFYEQSRLNVSMAINKYHQEVNIQLEQLHDLESAEEFANEYYRVRKKAFNEGMATTTEVSDANLALAKVKIDRLQAVYNYDVALSKLLFYAGLMDEFGSYQTAENVQFCKH